MVAGRLRVAAAACSLLTLAAGAEAQTLTGTGGFVWDVDGAADGALVDGTADAYERMYTLSVGGAAYSAGGAPAAVDSSGRRITTASRALAGLDLRRRVFVPPVTSWWGDASTGFARYEEILTNTSGADITVSVVVGGALGSGADTVRTGSSSGDLVLDGDDDWFGTDDVDALGDPSLAHVMQGDGAPSRASFALTGGSPSWAWSVTVPAGSTRRVVYFAVQAIDRAHAEGLAERLRLWSIPDQWDGLTAGELAEVVNWRFATGATVDTVVGGYLYDVSTATGGLAGGTSGAYDSMYEIAINGSAYAAGGRPILMLEAGKLLVLAPHDAGALRVQRMWWLQSGNSIARASVIVHNPSSAAAPASTRVHGVLGASAATSVVATSDGDAIFEPTDAWLVTDDADGSGAPALGHVLDDLGPVSSVSLVGAELSWTYSDASVPAGDAALWIFFATQGASRSQAANDAELARRTGTDGVGLGATSSGALSAWAPAWSSRSRTFAMTTQYLRSIDGRFIDIALTRSGEASSGEYENALTLDVGATRVRWASAFGLARVTDAGRGYVLPSFTVGGVYVQRRILASPGAFEGYFRVYDVFANPDGARTIDVTLAAESSGSVSETSDGDTIVEATDSWYTLGASILSPNIAYVVKHRGRVLEPPDTAGFTGGLLSWTFAGVAIPPHDSVALMTFTAQADRASGAGVRAADLDDLGGLSTAGLSAADLARAMNFVLATLPSGAVCAIDDDCTSGFCVDGVCCDAACGGGATDDCRACSIAAGGTTDGRCGALSSAVAPTVVCRAANGPCDLEDVCSPARTDCLDRYATSTTVCRPSEGPCDAAERCNGLSPTCPTDRAASAGTVCRTATAACDATEVCDGTSKTCPEDALAAAGVECRASAGVCDLAEVCDGASAACPADVRRPAAVICRPEAGACDLAEACDGLSAECPPDLVLSAGVECRVGGDACDPSEVCDGVSGACPADVVLADGASCGDGVACNGAEACASGSCVPGAALECDDGDACTADACAEPDGCAHTPIEGCCVDALECDDGDPCTADACEASRCTHAAMEGCGGDGGVADAGGDAGEDAGVGEDASVADDASAADAGPPPSIEGCGCRAGSGRTPGAALLALLALATTRRARRARPR